MTKKYKVYVEDGECKLWVYPDSPYDWSREPGMLIESDFTPDTHNLGQVEYNPATRTIREKGPPVS